MSATNCQWPWNVGGLQSIANPRDEHNPVVTADLHEAVTPFLRPGWFVTDSDDKLITLTVTVGELRALNAALRKARRE